MCDFLVISQPNEISRVDIEKMLHIGTTSAVKLIKTMLDKEIIRKIGSGKNTKYRLN